MDQVPVTRDTLRNLKNKRDEEIRIQKVNACISKVYSDIIHKAKTSIETSYYYMLPSVPVSNSTHLPVPHPEFHRENKEDILNGLRTLFPDCSVEYSALTLIQGQDGKLYDISKMDEKVMQFAFHPSYRNNRNTSQELYIVIDWS
jgi:hypothetical protein